LFSLKETRNAIATIGSSPANTAHRTRGRHKFRFTNVMASLLLPNHFMKPGFDLLVGSAIAQFGAQVMFGDAEEARPDLAIGSEPEPITMTAKWFADRRDDAQFATAIGEGPSLGGFRGIP
jgi:hypothetical protein